MDNNITLESLIQEHKNRLPYLRDVGQMFVNYEYPNMEEYHSWLAKTIRYIEIKYPGDKYVIEFCEVSRRSINLNQQRKLLAILQAFSELPTIIPNNSIKREYEKNDAINVTTTINNTNSQSQNQEQSLAVKLFIEAIKDDLTGRQVKELKEVVEEAGNDLPKARQGVLLKLKEFGADVASNIVANIITNPMIWSGM